MFFLKKGHTTACVGVILLLLVSCKSSQTDTSSLQDAIHAVIPVVSSTTYNEDRTLILVVAEPGNNEFSEFAVLNVRSHEVMLQKKFRPGHVKWAEANLIELLDAPGIIETDKRIEDYIQYLKINLPSKK